MNRMNKFNSFFGKVFNAIRKVINHIFHIMITFKILNGGMAVNQTRVIMKNVILTHKELQMSIFMAFADGFCKGFQVPKGYFLTWGDDGKCFNLEFWKAATLAENGDGYEILKYGFNKGYNEMNDVRLGVM